MSDTQQLRQQLHEIIDSADNISLLDLQETIIAKKEQRWEWWKDIEFVGLS